MEEQFPDAEKRFCVRHLYNNFKGSYPGVALRDAVWGVARATYEGEFKRKMELLKGLDSNAWAWMKEVDPCYWSRAFFMEFPKCDILLNNMCECFNRFIIDARDKPILTMLEIVRCKIMVRIAKKREIQGRWTGRLCQKILKKLNRNIEFSKNCWPMESGGTKFQVTTPTDQHVVDIEDRKCSCRKWELTGIPCIHACSALAMHRGNPEEYVDECYTVDTHKLIYGNLIHPIRSADQWEDMGHNPIKPPNHVVVKRGRPKKKRRREQGEPECTNKMRKTGMLVHCSICKQPGHNKTTCKGKGSSSAPSGQRTARVRRGTNSQSLRNNVS